MGESFSLSLAPSGGVTHVVIHSVNGVSHFRVRVKWINVSYFSVSVNWHFQFSSPPSPSVSLWHYCSYCCHKDNVSNVATGNRPGYCPKQKQRSQDSQFHLDVRSNVALWKSHNKHSVVLISRPVLLFTDVVEKMQVLNTLWHNTDALHWANAHGSLSLTLPLYSAFSQCCPFFFCSVEFPQSVRLTHHYLGMVTGKDSASS